MTSGFAVKSSILSHALSEDSHVFLLYFCGLRSRLHNQLLVKSVAANSTPINLSKSACILNCGASRDVSWRIEGDEIKRRWLSIGGSTVTGLLCRHTSEKPVTSWLVELALSSSTSAPVKETSMELHCPANSIAEAGKQSIRIKDCADGFLDVYYLAISPTEHNQDGLSRNVSSLAKDLDPVNYPGFPLRPVSTQPVSPGEVLLVGHRGLGAEVADTPSDSQWPENTLLSFLKAHQLGLPMVELDVQPMRDDSDFVLYHNFNLRTKEAAQSSTQSCSCPKYQLDLFAYGRVNRKTPNLLPTLSREDIEIILTGAHTGDCSHAGLESVALSASAQTHGAANLELNRVSPLAHYLPLFSDLLKLTPHDLALDVELKYPVETPLTAFKLMHELGQNEESLAGYGCPYDYYYPINKYVDNLLNILWKFGRNRRILLSSFNPDMCLALKLKQSTYPVLFISRAGLETPDDVDWVHTLDPRHLNALSSAYWAHLANLDGVVLHSCCLQASPSGPDESTRQLLSFLAENRLSCIPYGPGISTAEYRKYAAQVGLTGVCINDVVDLAKTQDLRWTPKE